MKDLGLKRGPAQPLRRDRWAEMRSTRRVQTAKTGRLAYGGLTPGVVNCRILDLSEAGLRVETSAMLEPVPAFFSVEFCGIYCRARQCWADGREIGLEFIFETK
jgi:hypothetical protein